MREKIDLFLGIIIVLYTIVLRILRPKGFAFDKEILILGCLFIIYHFVKGYLRSFFDKSKHGKILEKILVVAAGILCIGFIMLEGLIISYPNHNEEKGDYILVLGAGIEDDKPSLILKYRLDKAEEEYNRHKESIIVVSGGQGSDEITSEAYVMKQYLVGKGIPEDKIIEEDKSSNTFENFKFSKEKIEMNSGMKIEDIKVKIITTNFHAFRSSIIAERNGYKMITIDSSRGVGYLTPLMYIRESFALVKSYFFDK